MGSTTSNTVNTTDSDVVFHTDILHINSYVPVRYYNVKYYTTSISEWKYWVYQADTVYPTLDESNNYIGNLEMLPIVTLRNSKININADKESGRYKQSQQMLTYLGLDIDDLTDAISENDSIDNIEDVFVHFGLQPSEDSDVVSKALFETFEFIYNDSGLIQSSNKYVATVTEGSFNAAMAWTGQSRVVTSGIIGSKGILHTCY